MSGWSLVSEYLALIIVVVIAMFFYDRQQAATDKRRIFWLCLGLTAGAIVLNIVSVFVLNGDFAIWVDMALCTLYFAVSVVMSNAISFYLLDRSYEFVYDKRGLSVCRTILIVLTAAYMLLLLWNFGSGVLFMIGLDGSYIRGPLNAAGYIAPLAGAILLIVCYFRHMGSMGQAMVRIVSTAPIVVSLLVLFQILYPEQLLNGIMAALVILIAFISFQSNRIERDSLTGLPNRQSFVSELGMRAAGRQRCQVVVVALRRYARVNEIYGHAGGDALLFHIAETIRQKAASWGGRAYRYNNVEFLMYLPAASAQESDERLQEITRLMGEEWQLGGHSVWVPAVAAELRYDDQDWTPEQIVAYLDYSIQLAKDRSLQLVRYDESTAGMHARQEYVINLMQNALHTGSFRVWFQPVYHADTHCFDSAEALLRLADDDGSLIPPDEFIPLAERVGLIDDLTVIVLDEVCRLLGSEDVPGLRTVSVNMSMRQLLQKDLPQYVRDSLVKYDVDPSRLKLEVTERSVIDSGDMALRAMSDLRESGLEFMLDDFGTGYSNLASVLNLPFESIKLDRSLVQDLPEDDKAAEFLRMLIPLFHKLDHTVVVEGVETAEQADMVLGFRADKIQGFYYARPMPEFELVQWYRDKCLGE